MLYRCYNAESKGYIHYGGRGITVCDEWKNSFTAFREWALTNGYDVTAPPRQCSLDRINVNAGYCPENCRFVDAYVQANNKRNSHFITHKGETKTISQWARRYGVSIAYLYDKPEQTEHKMCALDDGKMIFGKHKIIPWKRGREREAEFSKVDCR